MNVWECRDCKGYSYVYDSRKLKDGYIHRRRQCAICGRRWETVEIAIKRTTPVSEFLKDAGFE